MNAKTHHRLQFGLELAHYMRENTHRTEIYAKVYLCTLIAAYGFATGGPSQYIAGYMSAIWILDLGTLWKAIQEVRRRERDRPPIQYDENDPPPRRER